MVKKQSVVLVVALLSIMSSAFGLGLGDIKVDSNLNDPLSAEINLIQLQGLTSGEILPALASNDDFRRAGIDRTFFLANIQFLVEERDSGEIFITLSTKQVVREPFLNFLLEINWPGGRLLKEYVVLLDPPVFDTGLAVDALVIDSSTTGGSVDLVTSTVVNNSVVNETQAVAQPVTPRVDSLDSGEYRVRRNDTLWEIALNVPGGSEYTPQQVMLAIQDLNPDAFLDGNINRVKAGSVLTLPDSGQISTRSLQEAVNEVQGQNRGAAAKLRTPINSDSEVQLSANESTSSALPSNEGDKNPDGYLELTPDDTDATTTASGDSSAQIDQLQNQLSTAEELNDQFEHERDDLQSRVSELQEQIEIMERLLDIQNSDLAQVQQTLSQSGETEVSATDSQTTIDDTTAIDTASLDTTATDAATTDTANDDQVTPESDVTPEPAVEVTPAPIVTPAPAPAPAPAFSDPSIMDMFNEYVAKAMDWIMKSTTNMIAAGLGLLLILFMPFYIRSKRKGSDKTLVEMVQEAEEYEEVDDFGSDLDDDLLADIDDEFEEEAESEPESLDAVMEAEMYMAYQKYDQAEDKLKEAFSEHPDRADIGLKLLEVYSETGNASAFSALEERLSLTPDQQAEADSLRDKLPESDSDDNSDFMSSDMDLDIDLGLDDTDSDLDTMSSGLDFELGLDDEEPATPSDDRSIDYVVDLDDSVPELSVDSFGSESSEVGSLEPAMDLDLADRSTEESIESDLDFSLDLGDLEETDDSDISGDLDFSLDDSLSDSDIPELSSDLDNTESSTDLDFSLDLSEELGLDSELDLSTDLDLSSDMDLGGSSETLLSEVSETEGLSLDDDLELESDFSVESGDELSLDIGNEPIDSTPTTEIDLNDDSGVDQLQQLADSLESDAELEEDEFDFLSGNDEASTKLDLARAYIEMDDKEGARDILEEVAQEGSADQKSQARELIEQL